MNILSFTGTLYKEDYIFDCYMELCNVDLSQSYLEFNCIPCPTESLYENLVYRINENCCSSIKLTIAKELYKLKYGKVMNEQRVCLGDLINHRGGSVIKLSQLYLNFLTLHGDLKATLTLQKTDMPVSSFIHVGVSNVSTINTLYSRQLPAFVQHFRYCNHVGATNKWLLFTVEDKPCVIIDNKRIIPSKDVSKFREYFGIPSSYEEQEWYIVGPLSTPDVKMSTIVNTDVCSIIILYEETLFRDETLDTEEIISIPGVLGTSNVYEFCYYDGKNIYCSPYTVNLDESYIELNRSLSVTDRYLYTSLIYQLNTEESSTVLPQGKEVINRIYLRDLHLGEPITKLSHLSLCFTEPSINFRGTLILKIHKNL